MPEKLTFEAVPVAIESAGEFSAWVRPRDWAYFHSVLIPTTFTAGAIGLQISVDGGTTPITVNDFATQVAAVIAASGEEAARLIDFGDLIRSFCEQAVNNLEDNLFVLRFTCGAQAAARELTWFQRGG